MQCCDGGRRTNNEKCSKRFNLVSDYGGSQPILFPHDMKPDLLTLAKSALYAKPAFGNSNLRQGM